MRSQRRTEENMAAVGGGGGWEMKVRLELSSLSSSHQWELVRCRRVAAMGLGREGVRVRVCGKESRQCRMHGPRDDGIEYTLGPSQHFRPVAAMGVVVAVVVVPVAWWW